MADTVWRFDTARFSIRLEIDQDYHFQYDGDDESGGIQAALDSGNMIAFDFSVVVYLDEEEIASASLGGSVYEVGNIAEFWTAHRDPDPMNRNCSIMRAARGENVRIVHYFPDMVSTAVAEARKALRNDPHIRIRAS